MFLPDPRIRDAIMQLRERLTGAENDLSELQSSLVKLRNDFSAAKSTFSSEISSLQSKVNSLANNMKTINNELSQLQSALSSLEESFNSTKNTFSNEISSLKSKANSLSNSISSLSSQISQLQNRLSELESDLSGLEENFNSVKSTLSSEIASLQSKVNSLQSTLNSIKGDVQALQSDVASLKDKFVWYANLFAGRVNAERGAALAKIVDLVIYGGIANYLNNSGVGESISHEFQCTYVIAGTECAFGILSANNGSSNLSGYTESREDYSAPFVQFADFGAHIMNLLSSANASSCDPKLGYMEKYGTSIVNRRIVQLKLLDGSGNGYRLFFPEIPVLMEIGDYFLFSTPALSFNGTQNVFMACRGSQAVYKVCWPLLYGGNSKHVSGSLPAEFITGTSEEARIYLDPDIYDPLYPSAIYPDGRVDGSPRKYATSHALLGRVSNHLSLPPFEPDKFILLRSYSGLDEDATLAAGNWGKCIPRMAIWMRVA